MLDRSLLILSPILKLKVDYVSVYGFGLVPNRIVHAKLREVFELVMARSTILKDP